ncbi:Postreplication repair E3 ubiquitin-protein ligase RAD18 [Spathaspora sp. JA1]|nr:Postreplication repair E3 ubiquitin-protein ligase RAD18 [Spathaspora sp. JA1]
MSISPFKLNSTEITDPSDFKSTKIPALSELDNLKRCYICKEFFRAPVITTCNHTFCSQCIREYLITNNICPLCKTEVFESTLKRDVLLEEVVSCYVSLRPFLLKFLQSEDKSDDDNSVVEINKTSDVSKKRALEEEIIEVSDSNDDESDHIQQDVSNKRRKSESPEDEELVSCPVCSTQMSADFLQSSHLDDCLSGKITKKYVVKEKKKQQQPRNSISSFFKPRVSHNSTTTSTSNPPENLGNEQYYFKPTSRHNPEIKRLPKLDFSSLITPKLKEKLAAINLPTHGTRNQLELRYNQYFVLYNSNLDSNRPISEKILKQKLNQWELSHREFNNNHNGDLFTSQRGISHRSITDKNFSVNEWMNEYNQDFKQLIKIARASAKKSSTTNKESEETVSGKESYSTDVSSDTNNLSNDITAGTSDTPVSESFEPKEEKQVGIGEVEIADLDFASSPLFSDSVN